MKITYFINQYPAVSHSFIRREIMALERQGMEVQRLSLRGWDTESINNDDQIEKDKTQYVLDKGVVPLFISLLKILFLSPIRFIKSLVLLFKINRNSDRTFLHHFISLAEACYILPLMKNFDSQHVHSHFGTNSTEVVMFANSLGGPSYSFTVHGPEEFDKPGAIHLKEKVKHSKFVAAISSFGQSQIYRWIDKSEWNKVKVIHCGLEKGFYQLEASTPMSKKPRLVCVGRLCEQKGQLLLVEACRQLTEKSIDYELVLAGDGELRKEIESLITKYKLEANIRITGWISSEQVRDEIIASKGMILPSFAEGLPVVIMEAMSLKRPVLSTYVAGIPELIISGENGWLFPAGDVEAITSTIAEFLSTPQSQLDQIAERGYLSVVKRHDIDNEATKLVSCFKSLSLV